MANDTAAPDGIAIIGMSGRFPGARDLDAFWANLRDGVESIRFFDEHELRAAGVDPELIARPGYVPANGVLDDAGLFDAAFFEYSPREAEMMDPQHRLFLETAWQAVEVAGYDAARYPGAVGVYAGTELSTYLLDQLRAGRGGGLGVGGDYDLMIGNTQEFAPLRVSYRLNLTGPSVCVQTACSTSLVAVHLACQGLLNGECELALAGGATVTTPLIRGYESRPGGILSPDGHCRAFDARARGTLAGSGVGVVVLKRLEDAIRDGDTIRAVIRGSAVNNDGALKVGFTAPSVQGQAAVIAEALAVAGVGADTIDYVEAHGTGTELGDPIEVAALTQAYREHTDRTEFCALGSVKTNIGHLDAAAGVAGLIKTVLALEHAELPPSLHYEAPNPAIDFARSPFFVNAARRPWPQRATSRRRAGVSSFGIGGTNAHVVLEEAPPAPAAVAQTARDRQLLVVSARTPTALAAAAGRLAQHLEEREDLDLADVAHTSRAGRRAFEHRRAIVCRDRAEALVLLRAEAGRPTTSPPARQGRPRVAFLFSGQGAQHARMAASVYDAAPTFRREVDACADLLLAEGIDLRGLLYRDREEDSALRLQRTELAQPALFVVELALARLWMAWGVQPSAMIGHSVGEYVAACLAGVFSAEDALRLVVARGRLMQATEPGAMLAVSLPAAAARERAGDALDLAAINGSDQCVLSGRSAAVDALQARLVAEGIACQRLATSHGFHSALVDPCVAEFEALVTKVPRHAPTLRYLSNLTGTWITAEQATSPRYWARHMREPVRFDDGLTAMWAEVDAAVEVGPGAGLAGLARRHRACPAGAVAVSSLPRATEREDDRAVLLRALGDLWQHGVTPDWEAFRGDERRRRVPLPTYPFERKRYWFDAAPRVEITPTPRPRDVPAAGDLYVPIWKQSLPVRASQRAQRWLVLLDEVGVGERLVERLRAAGHDVVATPPMMSLVAAELAQPDRIPDAIVHLGAVLRPDAPPAVVEDRGFFGLVSLARELAVAGVTSPLRLTVVSSDLQVVTGDERPMPEKALALGPCRVIPLEYPNVACVSVDLGLSEREPDLDRLADQLYAEVTSEASDGAVAYRGARRWVQAIEPLRIEAPAERPPLLRARGTYLITGGLGGIGLAIAEWLWEVAHATLVLVGRRADEAELPEAIARRLATLRERGARVIVAGGDVADRARMTELVQTVRAQVGPIHGLVHAAGVPGSGLLQTASEEAMRATLAPKVAGTSVLLELLDGPDLDVAVLMSSHSALLGGVGQADYAGANAYLDAVAQRQAARGRVLSIGWDLWRDVGMAVESFREVDRELARLRRAGAASTVEGVVEDAGVGITSAEGLRAFGQALASGVSHVIVSRRPFVLTSVSAPADDPSLVELVRASLTDGARYPRPELSETYVAPRTPTESAIAEIWQQLLGIAEIGVNDDFFQLGGHSLLATQLVSRLQGSVSVTLPLHTLFELRTVARLAEGVEAIRFAASARPRHVGVELDEGEL